MSELPVRQRQLDRVGDLQGFRQRRRRGLRLAQQRRRLHAPIDDSTATKPSSRVLITSLVPKRTFMTPAMPPQNAPASVPPSSGTITASPSGRLAIGGQRPSAVAAMPPTAIWPSPPTLVRLARKARMKPRPTSDSATARLIEAPIAKARAEGAVHERFDGVGHVLAARRDQQQADDHRADDGDERHRHAEQAATIRQARARAPSCDLPRHQGADARRVRSSRPGRSPTSRPR